MSIIDQIKPFGNTFEDGVRVANESGPETPHITVRIDMATMKAYVKESAGKLRGKSVALAIVTPLAHAVLGIANIAFRILRLVSFYNFWK